MQLLRRIPYYGVIALLVYMPLHIFFSQSPSLVTGGLEWWKVGKDVACIALLLFTICLVFWQKQGSRAFWWLAGLTAVYAGLHLALWAANPEIYSRSALLGMLFNVRLPAFALLAYGAYLLAPTKFVLSSLFKVILGVSTLVVVLGILQYFLPKDILTHLGYGIERGARPAFFIDDNPAFPRIMSTLREPNSLAAYLLVPITLLGALLMQQRERLQRIGLAMLLGLHAWALYLTHSRSGMLGLALALGMLVLWRYQHQAARVIRRWWPLVAAAFVLVCVVGFTVRHDPRIQGFITHSTPDADINDLDSNDYHWLFFKQGLDGSLQQPLGHGPGTAGLASIQNPKGSFLTENYYVQVAYEVGLLGLLLFVVISAWLYLRLLTADNTLSLVLLTSFWGLTAMNMLLHIWANEAVAAQWWLLAGVALGMAYGARHQAGGDG